jgi:hypothetical protein
MSVDEMRAQAQAIVDRAKSDSDFAARLKADPEGTMRESGLAEEAIPAFTEELAGASELEAHLARPCSGFSCLVTGCQDTCMITSWP